MRKELIIAAVIYFVTMFTLLMAVYRFLEDLQMSTFNFFVAGALVLLVAVGWGYVLIGLIFAPKKKMENTLSDLTHILFMNLTFLWQPSKPMQVCLKKAWKMKSL